MDDDDREEEEIILSGQELIKIRDAVVILIQSLLRLLQTFPLRDRPQSASNCTQVAAFCQHSHLINVKHRHAWHFILFLLKVFTKLLYFEPVDGVLSFAAVQWAIHFLHLSCWRMFFMIWRYRLFFMCRDITKLKSVPEMAFYGLQLLCLPKHGDQKEVRSKCQCSHNIKVFFCFTVDRSYKYQALYFSRLNLG